MSIKEAIGKLNILRHDGKVWSYSATGVVGRASGRGKWLTQFEAIAIAEKYQRDERKEDA